VTSLEVCHDGRTLVLGCSDGCLQSYVVIDVDYDDDWSLVLSRLATRDPNSKTSTNKRLSSSTVPAARRIWDKVRKRPECAYILTRLVPDQDLDCLTNLIVVLLVQYLKEYFCENFMYSNFMTSPAIRDRTRKPCWKLRVATCCLFRAFLPARAENRHNSTSDLKPDVRNVFMQQPRFYIGLKERAFLLYGAPFAR